MASGRLIDYLGVGLASARPASPDAYTGTLALWFATDTGVLSAWNGSGWEDIASADPIVAAPPSGGWSDGALLVYSAELGAWIEIPPGTPGQVLTQQSGDVVEWDDAAPGGVSSVNGQTGAVSLGLVELEDVLEPSGGWPDGALLQYQSGQWVEVEPGAEGEVLTMGPSGPVFLPASSGPSPTGNLLGSGGGVQWTGNYDYTVAAATYMIQGAPLASPQTDLTLSASDPTLDRIDIIALSSSGTAVVLEGTASATPAAPDVDPSTHIALTFVYVAAASTSPEAFDENIYIDNAEWNASASAGSINVASTNNPLSGTRCIEGTAVAANAYAQLEAPSGTFDLNEFDSLVLYVRSKAAWPAAKSLAVRWLDNGANRGVTVTVKTGTFGFDSSITTNYQLIVIPTELFSVGGLDVNQLRITVVGGGGSIGFYIDNILLQGGVAAPATIDALRWRGDYSPVVQYVRNDVVRTGAGSTLALWIALQPTLANTPAEGLNWHRLTPEATGGGAVDSVNGQTGVVSLGLDDLDDVLPNTGTPDDGDVLTWDEASSAWVASQPAAGAPVPSFRLTLKSGDPCPRDELSDIGTIYWTPYQGNTVQLWDGSAWTTYTSAEISLALSGLTSGVMYDLFVYQNAGAPTLDSPVAWRNSGQAISNLTNATPIVVTANSHGLTTGDEIYLGAVNPIGAVGKWTVTVLTANTFELDSSTAAGAYVSGGFFSARVGASKPTMQDGRYCKSSDKTRLYVGTFRATGTGTTQSTAGGQSDSVGGKRFLWNYYNRVKLPMAVIETTDSWLYTTGTWRAANNTAANCVECVVGIFEDPVHGILNAAVSQSASSVRASLVGIGWNSSTTPQSLIGGAYNGNAAGTWVANCVPYAGERIAGYHLLQWMEYGGDGNSFFLGDNLGTAMGIVAWVNG